MADSLQHDSRSRIATTIEEHDFPIEEEYDAERRPTIWDDEDDVLHVGPIGALHAELSEEAGVPYRNTGYVNVDTDPDNEDEKVPVYLGSYDAIPSTVENAGRKYFGLKAWRDPEWEFGAKTAEQMQMFTPPEPEPEEPAGPPIEEHGEDEVPMGLGTYDPDRKPWIWDEATNTIHIGPRGAFHQDLASGLGIPYKNTGTIRYRGKAPKEVSSYSITRLIPQIEKHVGLEKPIGAKDWDFQASEEKHNLKWEPGLPGKGWIFNDGRVKTWNVDHESRPYHMHKMLKTDVPLRGEDGTNIGAFQIMPNGTVMRLGDHIHPEALKAIQAADPRLYQDEDWSGDWTNNWVKTVTEQATE